VKRDIDQIKLDIELARLTLRRLRVQKQLVELDRVEAELRAAGACRTETASRRGRPVGASQNRQVVKDGDG